MKFPSQLSSGWSGQAFGENKAAMAIVGNWVVGAMQADYPHIKYHTSQNASALADISVTAGRQLRPKRIRDRRAPSSRPG